ncbi:hypothetical protein BGX27_002166 [Mortierella sp. AM989]|nr:hypothetical protein BGX27_002166 [Mortierella sp. AM989]
MLSSKKSPQPYGIIPPRKKKTSAAHSLPSPSSSAPAVSSRSSLDIPSTNRTTAYTNTIKETSMGHESLLHSFQSLLLPDSTSYYRLGFWANLKAQFPPWVTAYATKSSTNNRTKNRDSIGCSRDFAPPIALMVSNGSPIVTLDSTILVASSTEDVLLSLPEVDSTLSSQNSSSNGLASGLYPVSLAAMDKLKVVMRTDIIPLKTFTYHETEVEEDKRPSSQRSNSVPFVKRSIPRPSPHVLSSSCRSGNNTPSTPEKKVEEELPLPRHLACRETRSNSDYLRMMAPEMRMIRARKLIAPLKPRGYLPRRKELFRNGKLPLPHCIAVADPNNDDDYDDGKSLFEVYVN